MREIVVGGFLGRNGFCGFDGIVLFQRRRMVEKRVVGDLEEPRFELAAVGIAVDCQVGLDQGFLRNVVSVSEIATAQGQQEASEGILLGFYLCYELISVQRYCWMIFLLSASISLARNFLPKKKPTRSAIPTASNAPPPRNVGIEDANEEYAP